MSVGTPGACDQALQAAESVLARAQAALSAKLAPSGKIDAAILDRHQHAAHGFAWLATYVAALRATLDWANNLERVGKFGERERLILQLGFTEYLAQILGGIPMSQGEMVRPADLGLGAGDLDKLASQRGQQDVSFTAVGYGLQQSFPDAASCARTASTVW